jgi:prevent-host-death family protein
MMILSVSEAKRQIKDLVEQVDQGDDVFYITRYSRPKAVMMGVEQYEGLVRQVSQLQDELTRIWAEIEAPSSEAEPILLPTPNGGARRFQPNRPVSPEVRAAIQRAALLAMSQQERTPQQIVQDGQVALERARMHASTLGSTINAELEAVLDEA